MSYFDMLPIELTEIIYKKKHHMEMQECVKIINHAGKYIYEIEPYKVEQIAKYDIMGATEEIITQYILK